MKNRVLALIILSVFILINAAVPALAASGDYISLTVEMSTEGKTGAGMDETVYKDENNIPFISFNAGDYQVFDFSVATSGIYVVTVYAGLTESGPVSALSYYNPLKNKYEEYSRKAIEKSGSFSVYGATKMGEFNLEAGSHRIKLSQTYSDIHFSRIEISKKPHDAIKLSVSDSTGSYNAEDGGEEEIKTISSGSYSAFSEGDWYTFDLSLNLAGSYKLSLIAGLKEAGAETEVYAYNSDRQTFELLLSNEIEANGSILSFGETNMGNVSLPSGTTQIKILQKTGEIRLSAVSFSYVDSAQSEKRDVHESSRSVNNATGESENAIKGEDGYFVSFNAGDIQEFNLYLLKGGTYSVTVYAGVGSGAECKLLLDRGSGQFVELSTFNPTESGSSAEIGMTEVGEFDLTSGLNIFRLKQISGDIHLSAIEITYLEAAETVEMTVEMSTAGKTSLGGDETVYNDAKGIPYVSFNSGDYQVFDFEVARSGRYEIILVAGLTSPGPIARVSLYNSEQASYDKFISKSIEPSGALTVYGETVMGEFNLTRGEARIKVLEEYSDIHLTGIKIRYKGVSKTELEVQALSCIPETMTATEENGLLLFDTPQRADYQVDIPASGSYEVTAYVVECFIREPQISLWEDNVELASARIPESITQSACLPVSLGTVNLEEGSHSFRLRHSGVTSSQFYLEKLVFTKCDSKKEIVIADETYLSGDMAADADDATLSGRTTVFSQNGVLAFDADVLESGYYLALVNSADGSAPYITITANERVLSGGREAFLIYLEQGSGRLTVSTHEACELDGISLKRLPHLTEDVMNSFVSQINLQASARDIEKVLEENAAAFGLDMDELKSGIFWFDAVLAGLVQRDFKSADEIIAELNALSKAEKTNPCVLLKNGSKKITALESGNLSVTVSSDKMRSDLSVVAAIYKGGRLIKLAKADYMGSEGTLELALGEITIDGTETIKIISLDNLSDISPVNIRSNIEAELFVSPDGDDTNDAVTAPVKTIKRAMELVGELTPDMTGDVIVNIGSGTYFEGETLVFDEAQSGKDGYNVIWQGEGEETILSGGVNITNWEYVEGGIYKAPFDGSEEVRNLYVNGYPAIRAKSESAFWINESYKSDDTELEFNGIVIEDEYFPKSISKPQDLEIVFEANWETQRFPAKNVTYDDTKATIMLDEAVLSHNAIVEGIALSAEKMIYLENAIELLDKPGEFYFDKEEGYIYYYPLETEVIDDCEIVAGVVEGLVSIGGTSAESKVKNLVFKDITFKYGIWNHASTYGYIGTQSDVYTNTITGDSGDMVFPQIAINYADNIIIEDCVFTCLGSTAIGMRTGVENVTISGSRFRDIAASGIYAGSNAHAESDATDVRCRNILIENNSFVRTSYEYRCCSAISIYYVNNVEISHNLIKDLPYSGITAGWGWGAADPKGWGNITISNNVFDNVMQCLDDGGGVYLLGHMRNTKISGNYFNKVGRISSSMYADSGTGYAEFRENVSTNSRQWLTIANIGLHDVRVRGNYSDTSRGLITSEEYINEGNVNDIDPNNLPEEALAIVKNAGLLNDYLSLGEGNELPEGRQSMIFISPKISYYEGYKFEAEDCKSYSTGIVYANSYLGVNSGASAVFDITVPTAGTYKLRAFIATPGTSSRIGAVYGGETILSADVPTTGAYSAFKMLDVGEITLPEGTSELTLKSLQGAFHLDCFILEPIE